MGKAANKVVSGGTKPLEKDYESFLRGFYLVSSDFK